MGYYNPGQQYPTLRLKWVANSCYANSGLQLLYAVKEFRDFFTLSRFKDESSK